MAKEATAIAVWRVVLGLSRDSWMWPCWRGRIMVVRRVGSSIEGLCGVSVVVCAVVQQHSLSAQQRCVISCAQFTLTGNCDND